MFEMILMLCFGILLGVTSMHYYRTGLLNHNKSLPELEDVKVGQYIVINGDIYQWTELKSDFTAEHTTLTFEMLTKYEAEHLRKMMNK